MSTKRANSNDAPAAAPSPAKRARSEEAKGEAEPSITKPHPDAAAITEACKGPWKFEGAKEYDYLNYTHLWLQTENVEETTKFYVRTLGWKLLFRHADQWVEFEGPGKVWLGFQFVEGCASANRKGCSIVSGSHDLKAAAAHLATKGVEVKVECSGVPQLATFEDNNGYKLQFCQMKDVDADTPAGEGPLRWTGWGAVKVACRSIEEVTSFYVDKLGCELDMKQDPYWAEVKLPGDFRIGFLKSDDLEIGDAWRIGLGSSNLAQTRLKMFKAGITTEPLQVNRAKYMQKLKFNDPAGVPLMIVAETKALGNTKVPHPDSEMHCETWKQQWGDGKFGWLNTSTLWLWCTNLDETVDFYINKLGWKLGSYYENLWADLMGPGQLSVGFQVRPEGQTKHKERGVAISMGTTDADKTLTKLKANGIVFKEPQNKGPVVLHAFEDLEGHSLNVLGYGDMTMEPTESGGDESKGDESKKKEGEEMMKPWANSDPSYGYNGYGCITLASSDLNATQKFWTEKLGAKLGSRWGDMWLEVLIPGNLRIGFEQNEESKKWAKEDYWVGIFCTDHDAAKKSLDANGVSYEPKISECGPCKVLHFKDLAGNHLAAICMEGM